MIEVSRGPGEVISSNRSLRQGVFAHPDEVFQPRLVLRGLAARAPSAACVAVRWRVMLATRADGPRTECSVRYGAMVRDACTTRAGGPRTECSVRCGAMVRDACTTRAGGPRTQRSVRCGERARDACTTWVEGPCTECLDEEVCLIRSFFWLFILLILVACTSSVPTTESPSPLRTTTPSPSAAIIVEPTSTTASTITPTSPVAVAATPTPIPAVTYRGALVGRDANGAFTLGDPAAPLTLIDYSDFL